ncbi:MAG: RluA family pseudouridine synthase [Bacillota bacterium]|nr:RluA family pseudouridine synthase [Bacillota bacterium]
MDRFEIPVTAEMNGSRLDVFLAANLEDISRSYVQKLIEGGSVTLNDAACTEKKLKVKTGDVLVIQVPEPKKLEVLPEDIPLDIVYEDEDVIVINKPAGMVVHPANGNYSGTLVNALMHHCGDQLSSINGVIRPGIVHRIDKDTSGLLMVAKNDRAHNSLSKQLSEHTIIRRYSAIVYNNFKEDEGTVDAPIGRDPRNRLRNAVIPSGGKGRESAKHAVTHYKVVERFGRFTLIEARLETGRTHQIRVHMSYIGHPLLGDALYGPAKNKAGAKRQMLHAGKLGFVHPTTKENMLFESSLPDDFRSVLETIKNRT